VGILTVMSKPPGGLIFEIPEKILVPTVGGLAPKVTVARLVQPLKA
jgi:hypothetical protein